MTRACQCPACRALCRHEPGWFVPEEIDPVAGFLGMARATFIATYLIEQPTTAGGRALAPRREASAGACIFYNAGQCQIHPVKPLECRRVFGCEAPRRHRRLRDFIARRWG